MRTARLLTRWTIGLAALTLSALTSPVLADDVAMPAADTSNAAPAPVSTPSRGITMNKVEAQFGAPSERHDAVGHPPITRWDYPGFSVFFEYDHVIHSVVR